MELGELRNNLLRNWQAENLRNDFSFIAMDEKYREEELKTELIKNIEQFLQELGKGFSYLGREYKLQVGDTQRAVDMLFYNVFERRYYVIEVKVRKFETIHGKTEIKLGAYHQGLVCQVSEHVRF